MLFSHVVPTLKLAQDRVTFKEFGLTLGGQNGVRVVKYLVLLISENKKKVKNAKRIINGK